MTQPAAAASEDFQLADVFPPATREAWLALVSKALKGGDFEKRLVATTLDGLRVEPLYARAEQAQPIERASSGEPWRIAARVDHPNASDAARLALDDLNGGVNALVLVAGSSVAARGFGLRAATSANLAAALAGVILDIVHLRLDHTGPASPLIAAITGLVAERGHDPASLDLEFGLDPIGPLLITGALAEPWADVERQVSTAVKALRDQGYRGPFIACDLRAVHEAGATEAQELAYGLALGVHYVKALTAAGFSADDACRALSWIVPVDADQYLAIAKLRALRQAWAQIEAAFGATSQPIRIHAETSFRILTRRDPWVNILRGVQSTFSAAVGGADTITVLPFTVASGLPDAFARRVARNVQNVLAEEANLWRVADPAAGSGAIETLTRSLGQAAWDGFQQFERTGGLITAITSGQLQTDLAKSRAQRAHQIAHGRLLITGTSAFPLLGERTSGTLPVEPSPFPMPPQAAALTAEPLHRERLAEPFEQLRDAADTMAARTGRPPTVFLASLGAIAEHTARTTWIKNFLASGGIASVLSDGYASAAEAAAAFRASGCTVACICSSDETYGSHGAATAQALRHAGATTVYLAGRLGDLEADLRAAGVSDFLYAGQNLLTALSAIQAACR